jgi:hypothetical protein
VNMLFCLFVIYTRRKKEKEKEKKIFCLFC